MTMILCLTCQTDIYAQNERSMEQAEAEERVYAYMKAVSDGDAERAEKLRGEPDDMVDLMIRVNQECGVEEYEDIQVALYPMEQENTWVAAVSYDMRVSGIEQGLPGYEIMVVEQNTFNRWHLITFEVDDTLEGEIEDILDAEGISDAMDVCNQEYDAIAQENRKVDEWIKEYTNTVYVIYMEELEEETGEREAGEETGESEAAEETGERETGEESQEEVQRKDGPAGGNLGSLRPR